MLEYEYPPNLPSSCPPLLKLDRRRAALVRLGVRSAVTVVTVGSVVTIVIVVTVVTEMTAGIVVTFLFIVVTVVTLVRLGVGSVLNPFYYGGI